MTGKEKEKKRKYSEESLLSSVAVEPLPETGSETRRKKPQIKRPIIIEDSSHVSPRSSLKATSPTKVPISPFDPLPIPLFSAQRGFPRSEKAKDMRDDTEYNENKSAYARVKPNLTEGEWALFVKGKLAGTSRNKDDLLSKIQKSCYLVCVGKEDVVGEIHLIEARLENGTEPNGPRVHVKLPVSFQPSETETVVTEVDFKIDTGACVTTLTPKLVEELGMFPVGDGVYAGVFSGPQRVDTYICKIRAEDRDVTCHPVIIASSVLLGTNFLRFYRVTIEGNQVWLTANMEQL